VERIEYACAELLLRLAVHVSVEPLATSAPTLLVERGEVELCYSPILACTTRTPHVDALCFNDDGDWRWRGTFAVPLDVAGDRSAEFALRLRDDVILSLPAPVHGGLPSRDVLASRGRPRKRQARLWRGALALIVTGQLLVGPGVAPVRALAAGAVDSGGEGSGEPTPAPSGGESSEAPSSPAPTVEGEGTTPTTPGPEATPPPEQHEQTTEEGTKHAEPPAGPTGEAGPETPAQPATAPAATPPASAPGSVAAATAGTAPTSVQAAPRGGASSTRELNLPQARRIRRGSARRVHGAQPRHAPASHSAEAQDKQPSAFSIEAGALAPQIAELTGLLGGVEEGPPAYLVPIYKAAGHRYHVPWRVLAAINAIETDYGRNLSVSSAGAVGWMQFMPETWARWGVDADHDGIKNPYSPQDAIFAAARYLRASGAERDLAGAIFAYNHASWYVDDVLRLASSYQ
jgi:soluble lytic murein transglycosylase-like protein